jgi:hypothetical protein
MKVEKDLILEALMLIVCFAVHCQGVYFTHRYFINKIVDIIGDVCYQNHQCFKNTLRTCLGHLGGWDI